MGLLTFILFLIIAAAAAGAQALIVGWNSRAWAGAFVAYAIVLLLPALLPRLLGGA